MWWHIQTTEYCIRQPHQKIRKKKKNKEVLFCTDMKQISKIEYNTLHFVIILIRYTTTHILWAFTFTISSMYTVYTYFVYYVHYASFQIQILHFWKEKIRYIFPCICKKYISEKMHLKLLKLVAFGVAYWVYSGRILLVLTFESYYYLFQINKL